MRKLVFQKRRNSSDLKTHKLIRFHFQAISYLRDCNHEVFFSRPDRNGSFVHSRGPRTSAGRHGRIRRRRRRRRRNRRPQAAPRRGRRAPRSPHGSVQARPRVRQTPPRDRGGRLGGGRGRGRFHLAGDIHGSSVCEKVGKRKDGK